MGIPKTNSNGLISSPKKILKSPEPDITEININYKCLRQMVKKESGVTKLNVK